MAVGADNSLKRPPVHGNSLDFLRLVAAAGVVLSHLFWLRKTVSPAAAGYPTLLDLSGSIGVATFFVISGYVNYLSLEAHPSSALFYLKRIVRIAPAYVFVVCAQTVVFLLAFRSNVTWDAFPRYFLANLMTLNFIQPSFVKGIDAINASLWTIKVELMYYLVLPFLMPFLRQVKWIVAGIALSLLFAVIVPSAVIARQLPGMLYLFLLGVLLTRAGKIHWGVWIAPLLISGILFATGHAGRTIGDIGLYVLGIPVGLVAIFARVKWVRIRFDISYSLYLVHYPVILLTLMLTKASGVFLSDLVLIAATLAIASLVTFFIERPALVAGRRRISD